MTESWISSDNDLLFCMDYFTSLLLCSERCNPASEIGMVNSGKFIFFSYDSQHCCKIERNRSKSVLILEFALDCSKNNNLHSKSVHDVNWI